VAFRFLPQKVGFFDLFEEQANLAIDGARLLAELVDDLDGSKARRINEVEHETDVVTHQTIATPRKVFITPFDRNAIHYLTSRIDDVLDATNVIEDVVLENE